MNPDGRAADAGIQAGDIILEVNRQPVQSVEDLALGRQGGRREAGAVAGAPVGR